MTNTEKFKQKKIEIDSLRNQIGLSCSIYCDRISPKAGVTKENVDKLKSVAEGLRLVYHLLKMGIENQGGRTK